MLGSFGCCCQDKCDAAFTLVPGDAPCCFEYRVLTRVGVQIDRAHAAGEQNQVRPRLSLARTRIARVDHDRGQVEARVPSADRLSASSCLVGIEADHHQNRGALVDGSCHGQVHGPRVLLGLGIPSLRLDDYAEHRDGTSVVGNDHDVGQELGGHDRGHVGRCEPDGDAFRISDPHVQAFSFREFTQDV